jgi:hypothetical protein
LRCVQIQGEIGYGRIEFIAIPMQISMGKGTGTPCQIKNAKPKIYRRWMKAGRREVGCKVGEDEGVERVE